MAHHATLDITKENRHLGGLSGKLISVGGIMAAAGILLTVVIALATDDWKRFAFSYLTNFVYFLSIALGGLIFMLLQFLARAGWSVVVRRLAEIIAGTLPVFAILFIPVLFFLGELYHWTHEADRLGHYAGIKANYLTSTWFIIRMVAYFAIWALLSWLFLSKSTSQDANGDPKITVGLERLSAPGTILFALTASFFAFDAIMTLDYHWFSTIFGVYFFAGAMMSFLAFLALTCMWLQRSGILAHAISKEHYHDIGKFMFAFVVFWAYIGFSQYMLIWYANIPEETTWYHRRQENGWQYVSILLLFAHFIIPFLGLMSRWAKRDKGKLMFWAVWLLVMHWVDMYWLIVPEYDPSYVSFNVMDITCMVGMAGIFIVSGALVAGARSLVPERDPRLHESLAFHNF